MFVRIANLEDPGPNMVLSCLFRLLLQATVVRNFKMLKFRTHLSILK